MKNFVAQNNFITFAALEPAKPLNDAQIGGSFFYYTYMKASFAKPYSSPEQIVQILKQRGMLMDDERKAPGCLVVLYVVKAEKNGQNIVTKIIL